MTNDGTFNENNISINLYQIPDKHVGGTTPQLTILINLIQKMSTKTRRCTLPALHLPLTALQNSDTSNVTHFWNDKEKRRKKKDYKKYLTVCRGGITLWSSGTASKILKSLLILASRHKIDATFPHL
eukprot:TRINITY_DN3664_c0_g2_i1.p1 TRINITY_DN3664_c0_g2~~TRINITY_DN3664_c0_g2_i1.p1  ORF type:complete len:127 (+),score=11.68 TRINITY_DN3664_c0_g2_i1:465-845(+)